MWSLCMDLEYNPIRWVPSILSLMYNFHVSTCRCFSQCTRGGYTGAGKSYTECREG